MTIRPGAFTIDARQPSGSSGIATTELRQIIRTLWSTSRASDR